VVLPGAIADSRLPGRLSASGDRHRTLIATATIKRNGELVRVVDIGVADEAGELVAVGRATYATLV